MVIPARQSTSQQLHQLGRPIGNRLLPTAAREFNKATTYSLGVQQRRIHSSRRLPALFQDYSQRATKPPHTSWVKGWYSNLKLVIRGLQTLQPQTERFMAMPIQTAHDIAWSTR